MLKKQIGLLIPASSPSAPLVEVFSPAAAEEQGSDWLEELAGLGRFLQSGPAEGRSMVEQTVVVPRMRRVPASAWGLRKAFEAAAQAEVALEKAIEAADEAEALAPPPKRQRVQQDGLTVSLIA